MNSHFCILPTDIIQFLSLSLQEDIKAGSQQPLRVLRLPHPRTGIPALFLPTEHLSTKNVPSILEIQAVSPPNHRSWITGEEVVADGKMLLMTPIDPSFLLIPIIQAIQPNDGSLPKFRPADDIFEEAAKKLEAPNQTEESLSLSSQDILHFCSLACITKSLSHICDVKEISPEITVYRYSPSKTLEYMRNKVTRISSSSALDSSRTLVRSLAKDGLMEDGREELLKLGYTRAACDLVSQYLPPHLRDALTNTYDFSILQKLLDANKEESIRIAINSAPTKTQNKGQAKASGDKKRKAAKPSFGVEKLKRANTTGMAKLSSFFNKA